jgi:hypothetical protein
MSVNAPALRICEVVDYAASWLERAITVIDSNPYSTLPKPNDVRSSSFSRVSGKPHVLVDAPSPRIVTIPKVVENT